MPLVFSSVHRPTDTQELNQEWFVVENTGPNAISTHGCELTVAAPKGRPRPLLTMEPGFLLQPNEKIRLVTGSPAKKSQGAPPDEKDAKNYHLCLREAVLGKSGTTVRIARGQMELAKVVYQKS